LAREGDGKAQNATDLFFKGPETLEEQVLSKVVFALLDVGKAVVVSVSEGLFLIYRTQDLIKCVPASDSLEKITPEDDGEVLTFTEIDQVH